MRRLNEWIKGMIAAFCCHRSVYGQLSCWHGYAAWATDKPEIYAPMAALYFLLVLRP